MAINHLNDAMGGHPQLLRTLPAIQNSQATNNKIVSSESLNPTNTRLGAVSDTHVKQAAEKIQETVNNIAQNLQFSIDEDTGKTVVKVMDVQTQEVIRQIPSQEAISIARTLDKVQGLLLNDKA